MFFSQMNPIFSFVHMEEKEFIDEEVERFHPHCILEHDSHRGESAMIWGKGE